MLMMEDDGDDDLSIVCKQVVACGSHDSHHMGIVFNEQDVREHFEPPVIVQEFFNHNATIFKIFVVGSQVSVVRRPSIRDVGDSGMTTARPPGEWHTLTLACACGRRGNHLQQPAHASDQRQGAL